MTTNTIEVQNTTVPAKTQAPGSLRFDWAMTGVSAWLVGGLYADAWAHNHFRLETFFTPWHGVLYSGVLAVLVFLVGTFIKHRRQGYSLRYIMPVGYELSFLGIILFCFAGVGDMIWHILFGIEQSIDAALSPTHLAILTASVLVVSGPFRAAWHSTKRDRHSLRSLLPMVLSATFTLSAITVISQFAHPFVNLWPSDSTGLTYSTQSLAVASIVLQTLLLMGLILLMVRRWHLPFGALTCLLTLNITLLSFMQDDYQLIPVAIFAGLAADLLILRLKPSSTRIDALRIFAFTVPVILYLLYFLALKLTTGVYWTIHLWLGVTLVAGAFGFLLSFLLVPPPLPAHREEA
jgi:hypothetical protein